MESSLWIKSLPLKNVDFSFPLTLKKEQKWTDFEDMEKQIPKCLPRIICFPSWFPIQSAPERGSVYFTGRPSVLPFPSVIYRLWALEWVI